MSLLAFATDYMDRSDYDDPELYWVRCALCDEPVNPDDQVTRHGEKVHDYCAEVFCADSDCEGHDDDE